jgi:hypothetical protein
LLDSSAAAASGAAGSTTVVDTDGELGVGIPTDHDRPPATGTFVFGPDFDGTTFILAGNKLYPSKAKQPEYYPADNAVEISDIDNPPIAGVFWNGNVYVATKSDIHQVQGSSSETFFPYGLSTQTGAYFAPVQTEFIFIMARLTKTSLRKNLNLFFGA